MAALLAAHPRTPGWRRVRKALDQRGIQFGPAFTGLAAAHIADGTGATVLAEVGLPGSIRTQQQLRQCTLRCWMPASNRSPPTPVPFEACNGGLLLPLGVRRLRVYGPPATRATATRNVTRVADAGGRGRPRRLGRTRDGAADRRGLQMGPGSREQRARSCAERAAADHRMAATGAARGGARRAGTWLLVSTSDDRGCMATELTDALKLNGAQCTSVCWPQHADHSSNGEASAQPAPSRSIRRTGGPDGTEERRPRRAIAFQGGEYVQHLVRIARELPEVPGGAPRLYLATRNAQTCATRRRGQPGAGWAARFDAGDRHRTSAFACHPNRHG